MAGIGFRLKGYFSSVSITDRVKGTLFSVIVSCGPWLMTILTIGCISYFAQRRISQHELLVFKSLISYSFAASLITFGAIEMPLTRYLADKLFLEDKTTFVQVFNVIMIAALVFGTIGGWIFFSFFNWGFWTTLSSVLLFPTILSIWLSMIFLTAAKNYKRIAYGFLLGNLLTFVFSWQMGGMFGLSGFVIGYVTGQMAVAVILMVSLVIEFGGRQYYSLEFTSYFGRYKSLIFIGLAYYGAIWVDKLIFWLTPTGQWVEGLFYTNQYYDTAMFLSYLTIIPSMTIFFVQVETNFYVQYSYFFRSIENKVSLYVLEKSIEGIHESLRSSLMTLFKYQTFITVIAWYFSAEIVRYMELPPLMITVFRYGLIGAYLQAFFMFCNIVLLYFLAEKEVLKNYTIFFVTNGLFALISSFGDMKYIGLGYALSSLITLILSYMALNHRLNRIGVHTFMEQPMSSKGVLNLS